MNYLITGCNRGLGLGLIKALNNSLEKPKLIIATCRNLEKADELRKLAEVNKNIRILEIDLKNFDKYDEFVKNVETLVKDDGLNVLFNNAGAAPKSTRINFVQESDLSEIFKINTIAPIMMSKACLPLLKKASQKNDQTEMSTRRAAIINMTSYLGSVAANVEGGMYAYRTSKAALNAATKSLSIDLKDHNILCVCMHPGWVKTDMGGPKAPMNIENSCENMIQTLGKLTSNHNGTFIQYDGKQLPW